MRCIYYNVVRDDDGDIINDATITVYLAGSPTLASIYTSLTGTTATNSVTSNSKGEFTFYINRFDYCSDQKFKYTVAKTGISTKTYDYIDIDRIVTGSYTISTGTSVDVDLYVPEGVLYSVASGTTLEIDADFNAGLYQVFSGPGAITGLTKAYPEWFGAVRDGSTDDTTAIQAALDSLTSGGILYFSAGTYSFTNLTITNAGVTLQGSGWGSVLESSLAATGETATAILIQASNVTARDFKLTYATLPTALATSSTWVTTNNGIGVGVNPAASNTYYENVTIDHVWIYGGKTHGICIGRNINTTVTNCRIEETWGTGIWNTFPRQTKIVNNYIAETEDAGIDLTSNGTLVADPPWVDGYDAIVSGNTLYHVMSGISTHGIDNAIISDNIINTTYSYPITALEYTDNGHTKPGRVIIRGNQIINPWQLYGAGETQANDIYTTLSGGVFGCIYADVDNELIISDNLIYDNSDLVAEMTAIFASADKLTITGNNAEVEGTYGVRIGPYSNATSADKVKYLSMTGNTIVIASGKGTMMLYLNGVAEGVITGNTFDIGGAGLDNPYGRFVVSNYSTNVLITANRVNKGVGCSGSEYVDNGGSSEIILINNHGLTTYTRGYYATEADIGDDTAAINTTGKYPGKQVWDTTNNYYMTASGSGATDDWYGGTTAVTPTH
jgi:hypothetical protein